MSYSISTLLTRNLQDVFGENDPARRRAAVDEIFTEDCVFYEPGGGFLYYISYLFEGYPAPRTHSKVTTSGLSSFVAIALGLTQFFFESCYVFAQRDDNALVSLFSLARALQLPRIKRLSEGDPDFPETRQDSAD